MRNITAISIFGILGLVVIIATVFQLKYAPIENLGAFIVTAMAALGTCGVTIFSVFPYLPKDRLEATLCRRKKTMYIMIYNKGNHTVYLGSDKYHTAEEYDPYALWWPTKNNCTEKNSRQIYAHPGDNMAVPPHGTIGFPVSPKVFGKHDLNKIRIQVLTSSGFRIEVKNTIDQSENCQKTIKNKQKPAQI